jgi:hypothetical protein
VNAQKLDYSQGSLYVRWLAGGLYIDSSGDALLLDVSEGMAARLHADGLLARVRGILLTGGRIHAVAGLLPLLCAMESCWSGGEPLVLCFPLGDERGALIADSWVRGWGQRFPVVLDGQQPGVSWEMGDFSISTLAVRQGELVYESSSHKPSIVGHQGVAYRVQTPAGSVAFVPSTGGPVNALARLCDGVDLAVIEVGAKPWPSAREPWRLSFVQAVSVGSTARELWVVDDTGRVLQPDQVGLQH